MLIPSCQEAWILCIQERAGASVAGAKRTNDRNIGKEMKTKRGCNNLF